MKGIRNISELDAELAGLQTRKVQLETEIKNSVDDIKHGMQPLKIAGRIALGFIRKDASHDDILARGLGKGAQKLSKKLLLDGLPPIVRTIVAGMIENVTVNLASEKTTPIASYLGGLIKNFFYKKSEELSPESRVTLP
jgi:hypothetical protein